MGSGAQPTRIKGRHTRETCDPYRMTTTNLQLRNAHSAAQDAVQAYWDLLLHADPRLEKPYVVQIRKIREAKPFQGYCFATIGEVALFFQVLEATALKKLPPSEGPVLTPLPDGYVFKEVEPPKRPRRSAAKRATDGSELEEDAAPDELDAE